MDKCILEIDETILKNIGKGAFCAAKMMLAIAAIFWYVVASYKIEDILHDCFSAISFCGGILGILALEIGLITIVIRQYQTENEENNVCTTDDVEDDFQGCFSTDNPSEIATVEEIL